MKKQFQVLVVQRNDEHIADAKRAIDKIRRACVDIKAYIEENGVLPWDSIQSITTSATALVALQHRMIELTTMQYAVASFKPATKGRKRVQAR